MIASFHICASPTCTTRIRLHRHCDACLTTAAVELARVFEASLLEAFALCGEDIEAHRLEISAALAGIAQTRPSDWYKTNSPLGPLSHTEAIVLRAKTDIACFLVAQGGVAALRHLENLPLPLPHALADTERGEQPVSPAPFLVKGPGKRPAHFLGQPFDADTWERRRPPGLQHGGRSRCAGGSPATVARCGQRRRFGRAAAGVPDRGVCVVARSRPVRPLFTTPAPRAIPAHEEEAEIRFDAERQSAVGPSQDGLPDPLVPEFYLPLERLSYPNRQIFEWFLYLATQNQTNTNLVLQELRRMATNDAQLIQADQDLVTAFANYTAAQSSYVSDLLAQITNLKATTQPTTDPAITQAYADIEGIATKMNQATAAIQATLTPPSSSAQPDPTAETSTLPAGSSSSGTSPASSSSGSGDTSTSESSSTTADSPSSSPASTTEAAHETAATAEGAAAGDPAAS